ncbi:MAG: ABC transporter permease, partial [Planctomycetota bacterium]
MSLLQLVLKNMKQRGLSTTLTLASVALGVALAIALLVVQREGQKLFGQSDFGYDLVVGDKGSKL